MNSPDLLPTLAQAVHESSRTKLFLNGVLDTSVAPELHQAVLEAVASGNEVVVDLNKVERVDAAALQVLVALGAELGARNRAVGWNGCNSAVTEYLELAGVAAPKDSH